MNKTMIKSLTFFLSCRKVLDQYLSEYSMPESGKEIKEKKRYSGRFVDLVCDWHRKQMLLLSSPPDELAPILSYTLETIVK